MCLQEERSAKGELKQLLAATVQSERAAEKKLAHASSMLEASNSRLAAAEAALQVGPIFPRPPSQIPVVISRRTHSDTGAMPAGVMA